ncbi:MAG: hypothetical protein ACYSWO_29195 [Planctomycetota bacterium]
MIDVYIRSGGDSPDMVTFATAESGMAVTVAKGEREILSIIVPWPEYWMMMRELNACERALLASESGVDMGMGPLGLSFAGALGAAEKQK